MIDLLRELSFNYFFWFAVACVLGLLQLITDEFFFCGSCIGAVLTGVTLSVVDPAVVKANVNPSLPYILCGLGGLIGAILLRITERKRKEPKDINEQRYLGDDE